jgi:hypothetical protein
LWVLAVFLSALAGYLAHGGPAEGSERWIGLLVGAIVAGLALVGFEFGRRTAPPVVVFDPALVELVRAQAQKP